VPEATLSCPRCEAALPNGSASCDRCGHAVDVVTLGTVLAGSLSGLKPTNLVRVAAFSSLSLGLYYPVWFWRRREALNNLRSRTKLDDRVLVLSFSLLTLSVLLAWIVVPLRGSAEVAHAAPTVAKGVEVSSQLLCLLVLIVLWVQCFRVRRILLDHLNRYLGLGVSISWFYTLVFQILYLQRRINTILTAEPDDQPR
jgi:hypothetical protein